GVAIVARVIDGRAHFDALGSDPAQLTAHGGVVHFAAVPEDAILVGGGQHRHAAVRMVASVVPDLHVAVLFLAHAGQSRVQVLGDLEVRAGAEVDALPRAVRAGDVAAFAGRL